MNPAEDIKRIIRTLLDKNKNLAVYKMLSNSMLSEYSDPDLYAEKGRSAFFIGKEWEAAFNHAIAIDPENIKVRYYKGAILAEEGQLDQALSYFKNLIQAEGEVIQYCYGLAVTQFTAGQIDESLDSVNKVIELKPDHAYAYNLKANILSKRDDSIQAEKCLLNAIRLRPSFSVAYYNLATLYLRTKRLQDGINTFTDLIQHTQSAFEAYFGRARLFERSGDYLRASNDLEKYLVDATPEDRYYSSAMSLKKKLGRPKPGSDQKEIEVLLQEIKAYLLFTGSCVTHYTSLTVAKILLLDNGKFRISEGSFLNDTSEGRELFDYLPPISINVSGGQKTIAKAFAQKPFIGSFVDEEKNNDLTLWRMYGKENKEEARGCAITLDRRQVLQSIVSEIIGNDNVDASNDKEVNFYRVAYRAKSGSGDFMVSGLNTDELEKFNMLMKNLKKRVAKIVSNPGVDEIRRLQLTELLNSVAYLFKSAEYQYEQELRLIMLAEGILKTVDKSIVPPRVMIELFPIRSLVQSITLGPKVERAEEWGAAFYYDMLSSGYLPKIILSRIPFK